MNMMSKTVFLKVAVLVVRMQPDTIASLFS